ncbi:Cytochrome c-554 precursor [Stieleria neptunia]|uniref:Cytochrome c-554 n=1 Tax=Stieleria neptunia TaxID=2527979 RepID=A0A518HRU0_9BACT|nr:multiheme c-type cytochrome [Stieleria neptunia]QDV43566.1 Cytochrome c-554 precursor [Stieleria neptunia]
MTSHSKLVHSLIGTGGSFLCLTLMFGGCHRQQPTSFGLIFSGDTAGWITPCGCASNQSGGLARRQTLIDTQREQRPTIYVDVGGSASGTSEYHQVKLESILRGMMLMDLRAHNLGKTETDLGPDVLQRLAESTGTPWLSTNLSTKDGSWTPTRILVEEVGGCRVGIVGVIDPQLIHNDAWSVQDPVSAVVAALDQVETDVRIVLAYMDQGQLQSLAAALPEVHAVLGGPTGQSMSPNEIGEVVVMSATNKGKYVGELVIDASSDAQSYRTGDSRLIEVSSEMDESAAQVANLNAYYKRLSVLDFPADETGLVSSLTSHREGFAIAGSNRCATCHPPDDSVWHRSRHAHAWDVLVAKSAQFDPSCQQCHTTGYGIEAGFQNVASSPDHVHVGCENCHGPSHEHVNNPKVKTPWVAAQQCVRCHDRENSPLFQYDSYWSKIVHGVGADLPGNDSNLSEVEL